MAPLRQVKPLSSISENIVTKMLSKIKLAGCDSEKEDIVSVVQTYFMNYTNSNTSDQMIQSCCIYTLTDIDDKILCISLKVLQSENVKSLKPSCHLSNWRKRLSQETYECFEETLCR